MEEKGYQDIIKIVFMDLNYLLEDELSKTNEELMKADECYQKAEKLRDEMMSLLKEYNPDVPQKQISINQFLSKETSEQIQNNMHLYKKYIADLHKKQVIIECQLNANIRRAENQESILQGYGIIRTDNTIPPVSLKMLKSLLDKNYSYILFGGTDQ